MGAAASGRSGLTRREAAGATAAALAGIFAPSAALSAARSPDGKPIQRAAVSPEIAEAAEVAGMPGVRLWADSGQAFLAMLSALPKHAEAPWLALSGGGELGAYGAGLLAGWTASGKRPAFSVVTGVSTGALIAPYAFLGPAYDGALKQGYTKTDAADVFEIGGSPDSFFSSWPLRDTIARRVTAELVKAVSEQHRRGRRLLILTTNVDAQRPVLWNMGAIACHPGHDALLLFRNVLLASASIPGLFPPVMIEVVGNGRRFQEMHVDGGASTNLFVAPQDLLIDDGVQAVLPATRLCLVVNDTLRPDFAMTELTTPAVLGRAMSAAVRALTVLEVAQLFRLCVRQESASTSPS